MLKGYKTLLLNIFAAILPVLETADLTNVLDAKGMAVYGLLIMIANVVVRFFTTTPIGKAQ